jgi:hypothetical protein
MVPVKAVGVLFAALFCAPVAHATVDLIAIGSVSGTYEDLSIETAPPLENGVAGNRLGGLGSGIAYAGGTTFLTVPDRGPNAVSFNAAIDNTASYINRSTPSISVSRRATRAPYWRAILQARCHSCLRRPYAILHCCRAERRWSMAQVPVWVSGTARRP